MADIVISNGTLTLDGTMYRSDAFSKMLQIFGVEQLVISSAQVKPDGGGSKNFTITGNVEIFSVSLQG